MSGCFRLRHGGGRCVPAPFQPSLRLRFTFPLAEPQTEANESIPLNCLKRIRKLVLKHHFRVKFTTSKMDKENYRIIFTK